MDDFTLREAAVHEKRHWVRLTRACNNRCLFCLDSGAQDGRIVPDDEVRARLEEGRRSGAQRLILSGGEPTIHPRYLDFIRLGTELGYTWIQTVTNGRMFRYGVFARSAVQAGLREATFSMHGHTEDLHDRLVGHPGAFVQALAGLRRLMDLGVVVSVDVVLTRLNLPHLREILEFYLALGVREFDLLHLIPFGRGFDENREVLFADAAMIRRELDRALAVADRDGVVVWTNRLPIEYLEGREHLFQDPHKIYDEVLGEREAFRVLFETGALPECLGPRCEHCFIRLFCEAARRYAPRGAADGGGWNRPPDTGNRTPAAGFPAPDTGTATETGSETETGSGTAVRDDLAELDRTAVKDLRSGRRDWRQPWRFPARESLSEARAVTPDFPDFLAVRDLVGTPIQGLPRCLGGPEPGPQDWPALDPDVLREDRRVDLARFVSFFIRRLYRVKSLRCRACRYDPACAGLQVNVARLWGLGVLRPVPRSQE